MVLTTTPFHVEAYPRIDLSAAWKSMLAGRDAVAWRNQGGVLIGVGRVFSSGADKITIDVQFRDADYLPHICSIFELDVTITTRDGRRYVVTPCHICAQPVRTIIFKQDMWACMLYQSLTYRSKIIGNAVRNTERLRELDHALAFGRPRLMRHNQHAELEAEQLGLRTALGDCVVLPAAHHRPVLTATWNSPPPLLQLEGTASRRGRVALLQLLGLPLFAGASCAELRDQRIRNSLPSAFHKVAARQERPSRLQGCGASTI